MADCSKIWKDLTTLKLSLSISKNRPKYFDSGKGGAVLNVIEKDDDTN